MAESRQLRFGKAKGVILETGTDCSSFLNEHWGEKWQRETVERLGDAYFSLFRSFYVILFTFFLFFLFLFLFQPFVIRFFLKCDETRAQYALPSLMELSTFRDISRSSRSSLNDFTPFFFFFFLLFLLVACLWALASLTCRNYVLLSRQKEDWFYSRPAMRTKNEFLKLLVWKISKLFERNFKAKERKSWFCSNWKMLKRGW